MRAQVLAEGLPVCPVPVGTQAAVVNAAGVVETPSAAVGAAGSLAAAERPASRPSCRAADEEPEALSASQALKQPSQEVIKGSSACASDQVDASSFDPVRLH
jgi:hypothetical protein